MSNYNYDFLPYLQSLLKHCFCFHNTVTQTGISIIYSVVYFLVQNKERSKNYQEKMK